MILTVIATLEVPIDWYHQVHLRPVLRLIRISILIRILILTHIVRLVSINRQIFQVVKRDPVHFFGNRNVQAYGAQTLIEFWNYIFFRNPVQKIVYETNCYAETMRNMASLRQQYSCLN